MTKQFLTLIPYENQNSPGILHTVQNLILKRKRDMFKIFINYKYVMQQEKKQLKMKILWK